MPIKITVTVPESGQSVTWEAMNRQSAIKQAKIEASRGAKVEVRDGDKVIWSR